MLPQLEVGSSSHPHFLPLRLAPAQPCSHNPLSIYLAEREFLVSLFGEDPGSTPGPGGSGSGGEPGRSSSLGEYPSAGGGGVPTIPQLLDSVFESICRPLKVCAAGLLVNDCVGMWK